MKRTNSPVNLERRKRNTLTLLNTAKILVDRMSLGGLAGKSYYPSAGGKAERDIYKSLGYVLNLTFNHYLSMYKRNEIAKHVIEAKPEACWRKHPEVEEIDKDKEEITAFDQAWLDLVRERSIYHYLSRADKLAGIGWFGILYMGLDDVKNSDEMILPVEQGTERKLLYLRPYMVDDSAVAEWEEDPGNPRYGLPKVYKLSPKYSIKGITQSKDFKVHYTRVIHIAEGLLDNDVWGTPRLENVYNHLQALEYVVGGSAEMFWRGAFPGYGLEAKDDASFDAQSLDDLEDEIQAFLHDLQRYVRLEGVEMKSLQMQVASPKDHFDVLISMISAGCQIPKRILLGSERGELASSQDERDFCEPVILRALIDRCIDYGILPEPVNGYVIKWPELMPRSEKEEAEVSRIKAEALSKYVMSPGADQIVPPEVFLRDWLNFSSEQLAYIESLLESFEEEEEEEIE